MTANEPAESSSASIVNVAAIANVSTATVSRVLSGKRTKDDDIARRVRAAAHSLNYSVNFAASALRSTVTRTIGLIVPSVQDPFSARLIDTLEPLVNQSG
ncbi:LacI family DNA-binding transcriptional regulator, partial [Fusicatenibacter saccharivorans]|nr:LacI family DNA-binding transcriptional regulator [Fusicatenibacter saccharivorans]